jgi:hypothetical protein
MASAIIPYPAIDDRLNIESSVAFAVLKGAQSINQQRYSATSLSPSTININAVIPSLSTIVDREFLVETTFTIAVTGVPSNNQRLLGFGSSNTDGFVPSVLNSFPFSRLQNQAILQLNSSTFTMNMESEFDLFYKMMSQEDLDKYSDMCPVGRDVLLQNPTTATNQPLVSSVRSQYAGATQCSTYKTTRGCYPVTYTNIDDDTNYPNPLSNNGTTTYTAKFQVTTIEPVFISPLVWAYAQNNAGMTGISALNLTFNLLNNADRAFRASALNANALTPYTTIIQSIDKCTLLVNLLTAPPTQLMPLTQSLSYFESPVYKTSIELSSSSVTSSTISPNNVPDCMYLAVRKRIRSCYDVDGYMPITNVNITWGTTSGILSNATQAQLYQISKEAGLAMSFEEFRGKSQIANNIPNPLLTCGGFLCIPFGLVIANMDAFTTCGSIGNYSLQVSCQFDNSMTANDYGIVAQNYELLLVLQSSGVVVTSQGQTSTFIGLIDRNVVLTMGEEQNAQPKRAIGRLLGGGLFSSLKSMALPLAKALVPMARQALATSENKNANKLHQQLEKVGLGRPRHR